MTKTRLNHFEIHPFKTRLMELGISQLDLSISLQISQSLLSRYLNGWSPMPQKYELEIENILDSLNKPKPKRKLIPVRH